MFKPNWVGSQTCIDCIAYLERLQFSEMKLKNIFILRTKTNTKQPLRWKLAQSHKQLSAIP